MYEDKTTFVDFCTKTTVLVQFYPTNKSTVQFIPSLKKSNIEVLQSSSNEIRSYHNSKKYENFLHKLLMK